MIQYPNFEAVITFDTYENMLKTMNIRREIEKHRERNEKGTKEQITKCWLRIK